MCIESYKCEVRKIFNQGIDLTQYCMDMNTSAHVTFFNPRKMLKNNINNEENEHLYFFRSFFVPLSFYVCALNSLISRHA